MSSRFIELSAGRYRFALPLVAIRQILDLGGQGAEDPKRLGMVSVSLADAMNEPKQPGNPALLLFEGQMGPQVISVCELGEVFEAEKILPIPKTVRTRWPELLRGVIRRQNGEAVSMALAVDPSVLISIVEAHRFDRDAEAC